jgi:hypothetical protein
MSNQQNNYVDVDKQPTDVATLLEMDHNFVGWQMTPL